MSKFKSLFFLCFLVCSISVFGQEYVQTTTNSSYANKSFRTSGRFSIGHSDAELVGNSPLNIKTNWGNWMALVDGYKKDVYAFHNPNNGGRMELFIHDGITNTNNFGVFTIKRDGNIGIGTTSPGAKLEVKQSGTLGGVWNPTKSFFTISDAGASSMIMDSNEIYGSGTIHIGSKTGDIIRFRTVSETSTSDKMIIKANGYVGIGTTTPDAKLAVNGNIHTKEVKVDLIGWADYVFKDDYNLPSLQQVENHITQKGHLPNIPSAAEVAENGIQLGAMNAKLLEKIEELTLYTIAQEKRIKTLENTNSKLRSSDSRLRTLTTKNQDLEARLAKIEALLNK